MDVSSNSALLGEIKQFHSFNGAIQIPRGWMQCNGDVINEANYDAIHGAGSYVADGIADLVLNGKHTPDLIDKYVVGSSTTTQDGSSAITPVGVTGHQINLNHNHVVNPHNHVWYDKNDSDTPDQSFNSSGTLQNISQGSDKDAGGGYGISTNSINPLGSNYWTTKAAPETNSKLNSAQSIQPESIEVMYIIRVGI